MKGKILSVDHGEKTLATVNLRNSVISAFKEQVKSISVDIAVN
jgi:hypothetical protein